MRLDKLTIGSNKASSTHQFKNLKNVTIDFDEGHWVTVVIGWNGTGKSNVLEAIAIIFRDLIAYERAPEFAFQLAYQMGAGELKRHVHVNCDPDRKGEPLIFHVATPEQKKRADQAGSSSANGESELPPPGDRITASEFFKGQAAHLPRYVFSYYSGESTRMRDLFLPYLQEYYRALLDSKVDPAPKRLFYALPVHSQFVLLAFLIRPDQSVTSFLRENLGIDPEDGIESVLFVLRKPPWKSRSGDPRFWNARGLVQRFLDKLMRASLAPIALTRSVSTSIWNKNRATYEYQYLYLKDVASLRKLVGEQEPSEFFRDLESTYVSELIEEIRIRVRLASSDGSVTFKELSEGEQQLITVLGLLRFTSSSESLFLLDEPDTHLNPRWCVDYLSYLKEFVGQGTDEGGGSHVLLTTHNPLAIAELERQQVQVLRLSKDGGNRRVVACYPEEHPRGMGYAAIVTSDMFGITSTLDQSTQLLLERQRAFSAKTELTQEELLALDAINGRLDRLGFRFFHPDDEYSRYLRVRDEALRRKFEVTSPDELAASALAMSREEKEELAARLIQTLVHEETVEQGDASS